MEGFDDPITGGDMVRMLQKHIGDSGTLTKKRVKFDKRDKAERTWLHGKEFYCGALEDLEKEAKCAGAREFLTNSTVAVKDRTATEEQVRHEMVAKMGDSFDALAMATEASKATYKDQAHTISTLTVTNAELTATVKKLTDKIVALSEKLAAAAAAKPSSQRGGAPPGFSADANNTGSAADSDRVFMPTKKNKKGFKMFVSQQKCDHCGKLAYHLPKFCPNNPKRKLELAERALAKAKAEASK